MEPHYRFLGQVLADTTNVYSLEVSMYGQMLPNKKTFIPYTEEDCELFLRRDSNQRLATTETLIDPLRMIEIPASLRELFHYATPRILFKSLFPLRS